MTRFLRISIAWAVVLVIGFVLVFTLGRPLPTAAEELESALHPTTPVSEVSARQSADTIIRINHGEFAQVEPTIERRNDYGIDYWVLTYSKSTPSGPTGVVVSLVVDTGKVEVFTFP